MLFKYWFFSLLGLFTLFCVVWCSIFIKSRKVVYFPHISLFGLPKRFIVKYIPFLVVLLVILLTIASMYPFKIEHIFGERKVYNIILCLDVSNSMKENEKLETAKKIINDFLLKRDKEDRIGLVVFDNMPFKLSPLTSDRGYLLKILPSIYPAMVDMGGTSMYDALIETLKTFNPVYKNKIVILLSDGEDINSKSSIEDVIAVNRSVKAKIYTIGISSDIAFRQLERLAESSGGKAFFVKKNYEKALKDVFDEINRLEPSVIKEYRYDSEKPLDLWIKVAALILVFIILLKNIFHSYRERFGV